MADSVLERIAQHVETTVQGVTGIASVTRPTTLNTFEVEDNGALILQEAADEPVYDNGNPALLTWRQPFAIIVDRVVSENAATPLDQVFNAIVALVQQALTVDVTRGGLAHDTKMGAVVYAVQDNATIAQVVIEIFVKYRVSENDPFTQR